MGFSGHYSASASSAPRSYAAQRHGGLAAADRYCGISPASAAFPARTFGLFFGLLGYLLSMVCWYFALHRLPLSKAYALLSLSYILVWAAAIWLPGWHEPFYWQSLLGVAIIVAGVLTIFWPVKRR